MTPIKTASVASAILAAGLGSLAIAASPASYGFTVFGSIEAMNQGVDIGPKVKFDEISGRPGTWGLGALAGMAGEALLVDGRILVSRGADTGGEARPPEKGEGATMLGMATVHRWRTIRIRKDLDGAGLRAAVLSERERLGFDSDAAFPFRVSGTFHGLDWHVITGPGPAPMRRYKANAATGQLVGLYAGAEFEGKITRRGNRFHIHYLSRDMTKSGHMDDIHVPAGSVIHLPAR